MTKALSRRQLLAAGVVIPFGVAGRASAATGTPRLTMPRPTGPYRVGTAPLHLVDGPRGRELMISVWYPAVWDARRYPPDLWMPAAPFRALLAGVGLPPDAVTAPFTSGHLRAPVLHTLGRRPVIMYSHGSAGHRSESTVAVQELASHGYVVVTVDHTDNCYGEFPDGRLTVPGEGSFTPWDSTADIRFVIDRVEDIAAGRNPDAGRRPLPAGLSAAIDLHRIGMFGWSKGGTATALVMNSDRRVRAGLTFDAPLESQPRPVGQDRPFMLLTAENGREQDPVREFWEQLRGWRLNVHGVGAAHGSYCDHSALVPQLARILDLDPGTVESLIGTFDPAVAVRVSQTYPPAFFDLHLRHRGRGPRPGLPKVEFIP